MITVHRGRLGKVLTYCSSAFISCSGVVVRPSGLKKAREGHKTPFAGLLGEMIDPLQGAYPHLDEIIFNDQEGVFRLRRAGVEYSGGGYIHALDHRFYYLGTKLC